MKKTIIALILFAGAALAQSLPFDSMRGTYRVVTNEQDVAAIELLNASNAVAVSVSAGLTESNALRVAEIAGLVPQITGLYASNATVFASVGALELGTNGWNAAAALAATALQPSWAATGTVSRAEAAMMLASADSNAWIAVEAGSPWLYTVSADTTSVYIASAGSGWAGPPVGTALVYSEYSDPASYYTGTWGGDATLLAAVGGGPVFLTATLLDPPGEMQWTGAGDLPATLGGDGSGNDCVLDYLPVTNRYQILPESGTVILITQAVADHDGDPDAHPTLPRHSDVTNTVSAAVAAIPRVPTNAVTGWLLFDPGSNMWLRVSVSNWSFTVWEVVE